MTFLHHEIITQKKPSSIPGAPRAVLLLFLNRAPRGASGFAPDPNAGNGASATVNSVGRTRRKTKPTTLAKSPPTACANGARLILATGGVRPASITRGATHDMICGPWSRSLRYEIPALRYKIPGLRNSLPSSGSSRAWVAMRYKRPSRETCAEFMLDGNAIPSSLSIPNQNDFPRREPY